MVNKKTTPANINTASLRQRAEELLRKTPTETPTTEVQKLLHELSVHQTELELQNEELRQSQLELAESRDRLADLYDFAPVGYLTLDRGGNIREANLTAAAMLRTNRKQLLDRPLSSFMATDEADLLYLHLLRVFETGRQHTGDLHLFRQDEVPCHVRLESIKMGGAGPALCRTILSDITELTLAQQAAQRSQQLASLGTLAAGIAHEINSPLWMISLQAEEALAASESPDREQITTQCLQEITRLVERGGNIVTGILEFCKSDTSEKRLHSVADVLVNACEYTRERAATKQIAVHMEVPEDLPRVQLNPLQMEQVFINLLHNAIDASNAGGQVRVAASWNSEQLNIRVEDDGRGIASTNSHRVFEPFYTTRREDGGTGLGLCIANRIVEDHHGTIELMSQLDRGTTVTVSLPITES